MRRCKKYIVIVRLLIFIIIFSIMPLHSNICVTQVNANIRGKDGYIPITTADELNYIRNNTGLSYVLMNDIDLSEYKEWEPIKNFSGILDGNGFQIINLHIEKESFNVGLFGENKGIIKNLNLINPYIFIRNEGNNSKRYIGTLVGNNQGTISNVWVKNNSDKDLYNQVGYIGGLVGQNTGYIMDCHVESNVLGEVAGGLVGVNEKEEGNIIRCSSYGKIKGTMIVGGLVGRNLGQVRDSFSQASVGIGDVKLQIQMGGLAGSNTGKVYSSYAAGNTGKDVSNHVGGIAYYNNEAYGCFYDKDKLKTSNVTNISQGKNTSQMQRAELYMLNEWNFAETWTIIEEETYPFLLLQEKWIQQFTKYQVNDMGENNFSIKLKQEREMGSEYAIHYLIVPAYTSTPSAIQIHRGEDKIREDIVIGSSKRIMDVEEMIVMNAYLPVGEYMICFTVEKLGSPFPYPMLTPVQAFIFSVEAPVVQEEESDTETEEEFEEESDTETEEEFEEESDTEAEEEFEEEPGTETEEEFEEESDTGAEEEFEEESDTEAEEEFEEEPDTETEEEFEEEPGTETEEEFEEDSDTEAEEEFEEEPGTETEEEFEEDSDTETEEEFEEDSDTETEEEFEEESGTETEEEFEEEQDTKKEEDFGEQLPPQELENNTSTEELTQEISDKEKVTVDSKYLVQFMNQQNLQGVTSHLHLPNRGSMYHSEINWKSSNEKIFSNDGVLTHSPIINKDISITLTATLTTGAEIEITTFYVTIRPQSYNIGQDKEDTQHDDNYKRVDDDRNLTFEAKKSITTQPKILIDLDGKENQQNKLEDYNIQNNEWVINVGNLNKIMSVNIDSTLIAELVEEYPTLIIKLKTSYVTMNIPVDMMNQIIQREHNKIKSNQVDQNVILQINLQQKELEKDNISIFVNQLKDAQIISTWWEVSFKIMHDDKYIVSVDELIPYVLLDTSIPMIGDVSAVTALYYNEKEEKFEFAPAFVQESNIRVSMDKCGLYGIAFNPVSFIDTKGHWAEKSIHEAGSKLIVNGVGAGKYEPNTPVTHLEFNLMLERILGKAVKRNNAIQDTPITREEMASAIALSLRSLQNNNQEDSSILESFIDSDVVNLTYKDDMAYCVSKGIIVGMPSGLNSTNKLVPQGLTTRAEATVVILRILNNIQYINI